MILKHVKLENYTVFENLSIHFQEGIHVFIGENATGKTHLLKLLYAACRANRPDTDFGHKIVRTMLPDGYHLSRLIMKSQGNRTAKVRITASGDSQEKESVLSISFDRKTKKWSGSVTGKDSWEKAFAKDISNFIPAKEILSHSYQLSAATNVGNVRFDDTYLDIIDAAKIDLSMGKNSRTKNHLLKKIEEITDGKVKYDQKKDEFYLRKGNSSMEFNLVAEGVKKAGLLWILAKNGTLEKGSVLFWDEPEANLNPVHTSTIAELLLDLQQNGVQVFIATHDYFLAKYLDILSKQRNEADRVTFYSFYRSDDQEHTLCEIAEEFTLLQNNPIIETFIQIYRDEVLT